MEKLKHIVNGRAGIPTQFCMIPNIYEPITHTAQLLNQMTHLLPSCFSSLSQMYFHALIITGIAIFPHLVTLLSDFK